VGEEEAEHDDTVHTHQESISCCRHGQLPGIIDHQVQDLLAVESFLDSDVEMEGSVDTGQDAHKKQAASRNRNESSRLRWLYRCLFGLVGIISQIYGRSQGVFSISFSLGVFLGFRSK